MADHDLLPGLDTDVLLELLEPCVPGQGDAADGLAAAGGRAKRSRTAAWGCGEADDDDGNLSYFLQQLQEDGNLCSSGPARRGAAGAAEAESGSAGRSEEEEDDGGGKGGKGKLLPGSKSARNKANREKARRERLNEGFAELARLVDPTSKAPKTDKASLVVDAIRVITSLRAESNQLRQLNKFLEEKVADSEKQRSQLVMQQMMAHAQSTQAQQQAPPGMVGGGMMAPQQYGGVAPGVVYGMPHHGLHAVPPIARAYSGGAVHAHSSPASGEPVGSGMPQIKMSPGSLHGGGQPQEQQQQQGGAGGNVPSAAHSWLPPSTLDCSQDHKLRPPAA